MQLRCRFKDIVLLLALRAHNLTPHPATFEVQAPLRLSCTEKGSWDVSHIRQLYFFTYHPNRAPRTLPLAPKPETLHSKTRALTKSRDPPRADWNLSAQEARAPDPSGSVMWELQALPILLLGVPHYNYSMIYPRNSNPV